MPIIVRRGRPVADPRPRLPATIDASATTIGEPTPEPDDRHELARLALDLVLRTSEPIDAPRRWSVPAFGAEIDRTRSQLGPIRSREALLASFGREASIAATRGSRDGTAGPVRIAYSIRWLELGDGRARPAWASILAGALRDVAGSAALTNEPAVAGTP